MALVVCRLGQAVPVFRPDLPREFDRAAAVLIFPVPSSNYTVRGVQELTEAVGNLIRVKLREFIGPRQSRISSFSEGAITEARFFSKQLLENAILWGNRARADKSASIEIRADTNKIFILVVDQGDTRFELFNDPFMRQPTETRCDFLMRRKAAGREFETHGIFFRTLENKDVNYFYEFKGGSQIYFSLAWAG